METWFSLTKPMERDEGEATGVNSRIEADPHRAPPEKEAEAANKAGRRRQRRPAAKGIGVTPTNPGGSPATVRNPKPTEARIRTPAPIMERRPAPRIIRVPVPAAVTPEPPAAITVWPPVGVDHRNGRLPAQTVAIDVNPIAIRRQ